MPKVRSAELGSARPDLVGHEGRRRRAGRQAVTPGCLIVALVAMLTILGGCGDDESTKPAQAPVVTVVSPNGGESITGGGTWNISWTATDGDTPATSLTLFLEVSLNNGTDWLQIASNEANDGTYPWVSPSVATGTGLVRITVSDGVLTGTDTSDNPFSISTTPPPPPNQNDLGVGTATGPAGTTVSVPLTLDNDATIGDLQSTITFNASVVSFDRAEATGRGLLMTFTATPGGADRVALRFRSLEQSSIPVGAGAIATLFFHLVGGGGESTALTPTGTALLAPDGQALTVRVTAGMIQIEELPTAEELTAEGWVRFEAGDFAGAAQKFDEAIALDADHGPAYVGKGWTRLSTATDATVFEQATLVFDGAIARGEAGADARGGRAASLLARGGALLPEAAQDAILARQADGQFVFEHRTSFDVKDLNLLEAFAEAGRGRFTEARNAADRISPSGIVVGAPGTWIVDGVTYPTFDAAVLGYLHKMSNLHAG